MDMNRDSSDILWKYVNFDKQCNDEVDLIIHQKAKR